MDGRIHFLAAIDVGCSTSVGRIRSLNEDSLLALPGLYVVADGMGGHAAGEVASQLCVQTLERALPAGQRDRDSVQTAIETANEAILTHVGGHPDDQGMGTTVTGVVLAGGGETAHWVVFNLGDSRTYQFLDGQLRQLTVDHSEVQELVQRGELTADQARVHPSRNVVTRSLGVEQLGVTDFWRIPVSAGERLVLCSDGLSDELLDEAISGILADCPSAQGAADALVDAAVVHGGRDNVTVVVIDVAGVEDAADETTTPRASGAFA